MFYHSSSNSLIHTEPTRAQGECAKTFKFIHFVDVMESNWEGHLPIRHPTHKSVY